MFGSSRLSPKNVFTEKPRNSKFHTHVNCFAIFGLFFFFSFRIIFSKNRWNSVDQQIWLISINWSVSTPQLTFAFSQFKYVRSISICYVENRSRKKRIVIIDKLVNEFCIENELICVNFTHWCASVENGNASLTTNHYMAMRLSLRYECYERSFYFHTSLHWIITW